MEEWQEGGKISRGAEREVVVERSRSEEEVEGWREKQKEGGRSRKVEGEAEEWREKQKGGERS